MGEEGHPQCNTALFFQFLPSTHREEEMILVKFKFGQS